MSGSASTRRRVTPLALETPAVGSCESPFFATCASTPLKTLASRFGCRANESCERRHAPSARYSLLSGQMTLEEAVRFSSAREARLSAAADELTDRAARLKAKIKLVIVQIRLAVITEIKRVQFIL